MPRDASEDGEDAVLAAHRRGDEAELSRLYWQAAERVGAEGRTDEACFLAVQAYVSALAAGSAEAGAVRRYLRARGREA